MSRRPIKLAGITLGWLLGLWFELVYGWGRRVGWGAAIGEPIAMKMIERMLDYGHTALVLLYTMELMLDKAMSLLLNLLPPKCRIQRIAELIRVIIYDFTINK